MKAKTFSHCAVLMCSLVQISVACNDGVAHTPAADAEVLAESANEHAAAPQLEGADYLGLAQPSHGFQVRSVGIDIPAGADAEYCEVAQLPGDPGEAIYVNRFELGNEANSHHLIVYAVEPDSPAEDRARAFGLGNPVECIGPDGRFGRAGIQRMAGSQTPYQSTEMPAGVGRVFRGGQYIVFNYHYLNMQDRAIAARSAINVHVTSEAEVAHVAKEFGMSNYTFSVEPKSFGSVTGECHFDTAVVVGGVARHTHRWGAEFTAWFSGGERDGEEIWTSYDWENDAIPNFGDPVKLHAGDGLRFQCDFDNTTDRNLRFGTSATDEMCILFVLAWASEPGQTLGDVGCAIVWVDDDGIGHPADEAGGVPIPDQSAVESCRSFGDSDACTQCRCGVCATSMIGCGADADCSAITDCYGACPAGADCDETCRSVVDDHSSAIGPLTQMTSCFAGRCEQECNRQ